MDEDRSYKIYKYTNQIDGKFYIGRTKSSLACRAGHNGKKYYGCKHFGNAIKKHGWENFKSEILCSGLTYQEACDKEQELIAFYHANDPEIGYNILEGGEGPTKESLIKMKKEQTGKHLSEEHRRKISESLGKGENNANFGIKRSEEFKRKDSESKRGEKHPNWGKHLKESTRKKIGKGNSRAIKQFDLEGNFIKQWDNAYLAAKELNCTMSSINNCLRGLSHSSQGFLWEFVDGAKKAQYAETKKILDEKGTKAARKFAKEQNLKEKENQNPSTTIPEKEVEQ